MSRWYAFTALLFALFLSTDVLAENPASTRLITEEESAGCGKAPDIRLLERAKLENAEQGFILSRSGILALPSAPNPIFSLEEGFITDEKHPPVVRIKNGKDIVACGYVAAGNYYDLRQLKGVSSKATVEVEIFSPLTEKENKRWTVTKIALAKKIKEEEKADKPKHDYWRKWKAALKAAEELGAPWRLGFGDDAQGRKALAKFLELAKLTKAVGDHIDEPTAASLARLTAKLGALDCADWASSCPSIKTELDQALTKAKTPATAQPHLDTATAKLEAHERDAEEDFLKRLVNLRSEVEKVELCPDDSTEALCATKKENRGKAREAIDALSVQLMVPGIDRDTTDKLAKAIHKLWEAADQSSKDLEKAQEKRTAFTEWMADDAEFRDCKTSKTAPNYRLLTTYVLPLTIRPNYIQVQYGAGFEESQKIKPNSRITLFVTGVPEGVDISIHGEAQPTSRNADNLVDVLARWLPVVFKAASGMKDDSKSKDEPDHCKGPPPIRLLSVGEIHSTGQEVREIAGAKKGQDLKVFVCEGDECKPKEKSETVKTTLPLSTIPTFWDGFTFFLDGGFAFGAEHAFGPPSYVAVGEPVGGQQTYRLGYDDKKNRFTAALLLAARFRFGGPVGDTNLALATGPSIYPGTNKLPLQWDVRLGYRVLTGLYLTGGAGFRRVDVPRAAEIGEIRMAPNGGTEPTLTDTERQWQTVVMVGLSLDLGTVGAKASDLINGATGDDS